MITFLRAMILGVDVFFARIFCCCSSCSFSCSAAPPASTYSKHATSRQTNKVEAGHDVLWRKTVFAEGFLSRRPRELIPAGRQQSRRFPHSRRAARAPPPPRPGYGASVAVVIGALCACAHSAWCACSSIYCMHD
eukprot:COSAG01_NODE_6824_length_3482_cov_5.154597_4_plen_135_part_00